MPDALLFLADVLLLALVIVGMCLLHSQQKNREKVDAAVRELNTAVQRVLDARDKIIELGYEQDRKAAELRQYLNGFAGWLSLQRAIHDAAEAATKKD
jgi:hypothetical protein